MSNGGRSTYEILRGLTLPAEDQSVSVLGSAQINVNEAWREFVRTYGQAGDVPRLVRGASLPIGGDVVITVGLETLLGISGGPAMTPVPFRQTINASSAGSTIPRRTWGQSGIEGEPLDWPAGTTHVRLRRVTALNQSSARGATVVSPWAYTVLADGTIEHFFPNGISWVENQGQGRYALEEYGSGGERERDVVCLEVQAPWRPVEHYPNGWVSGCQLGNTAGGPKTTQILDFETLAP